LLYTAGTIVAFSFVPIQHYLKLSSAVNALSLYFHCTAWCVTSFLRYLYIDHEDLIQSVIPSLQRQSIIAVALTLIAYPCFAFPSFGYALSLGENLVTLNVA
jgi:hypothetical protein